MAALELRLVVKRGYRSIVVGRRVVVAPEVVTPRTEVKYSPPGRALSAPLIAGLAASAALTPVLGYTAWVLFPLLVLVVARRAARQAAEAAASLPRALPRDGVIRAIAEISEACSSGSAKNGVAAARVGDAVLRAECYTRYCVDLPVAPAAAAVASLASYSLGAPALGVALAAASVSLLLLSRRTCKKFRETASYPVFRPS